MRIFISFSGEWRSLAEKLCISLRHDGHTVFFDKDSLPKGESYDNLIRAELSKARLLIFLITPESVKEGSYALAELQIYREHNLVPSGRVLPVMIAPTSFDDIPNYLKGVNVLRPSGDPVAEVASQVSKIVAGQWAWKLKLAGVALAVLVLIGAIVYYLNSDSSEPGIQMRTLKGISMFSEPSQDSRIIERMTADQGFVFLPTKRQENWAQIRLENGQVGWVMAQDMSYVESTVKKIDVGRGFGFRGDYWQLFFTSPQPDSTQNQYGIDVRFADAIDKCQASLKIAVYELNSEIITEAIIEAKRRGVKVQVVTDDRSIEQEGFTFGQLVNAAIPLVTDSSRSSIMHDKFAIIDDKIVWTGSWNFTDGATYRNNENEIVLESPQIASVYKEKFNKMFDRGLFGRQGLADNAAGIAATKGKQELPNGIQIYFAPEDNTTDVLRAAISKAKRSVRIMALTLTLDDLAAALNEKVKAGIVVEGIIEKRFSRSSKTASFIDTTNVTIRLDGNRYMLHHNSIIIDDELVITGSLNFSRAATSRNDENIILIPDAALAAKYNAEFKRLWRVSTEVPVVD
jgi:phosphatidylserine/phosphatidylglycerophosphate/cardiolipin synthase-like enzyme